MTQYNPAETKFRAVREAVRQDRPDIAVDILSAKPSVRARVRSPASPLGIQIHTRKPFPTGTKTVVIVDFGPKGNEKLFYVVPVRAVKRVTDQAKANKKPRPVNPDSDHCYMAPEKLFAEYRDAWHLVPTGTQTGENHIMYIGDELVDPSDIREALDWLGDHMGSEHDTFTNAMRVRNNPLAKWSAGRIYKGLHRNADKPSIRAFLWGRLAEYEDVAAAESAGTVIMGSGQGFAVNQEDKVAVENRGMAVARMHYAGRGWKEDEADKDACKHNPFDLILTRDGEVLHVEVKGTQQPFKGITNPEITVFLTANEVAHARCCQAKPPCQWTKLFILTDVIITQDGAASIGSGGETHVRDFSNLDDEHLIPIRYRYTS